MLSLNMSNDIIFIFQSIWLKFRFNILWDVADSILIRAHELKASQFLHLAQPWIAQNDLSCLDS